MEWIRFSDVEFAESQHGYYFVYKKFDHETGMGHWFADTKKETTLLASACPVGRFAYAEMFAAANFCQRQRSSR